MIPCERKNTMSGGLESIAAASDDMLIPGLNFKLPQGASYVSQRRFSTFFPQGSNIYSTTGTRLIRFVLSDATNLLDLSTFRLAFQMTNSDGANWMQPTGHPGMCWFNGAGSMWEGASAKTSCSPIGSPEC